jgi:hypothetical protein
MSAIGRSIRTFASSCRCDTGILPSRMQHWAPEKEKMAIDAQGVAAEIVREVAAAPGGEVGVDVGGWSGQDLRALLDALLAGLAASPWRLQGVQADCASFAKLGLPRDAPSSARHEGVPVLMTDLEPDTLLFTFAQRWP